MMWFENNEFSPVTIKREGLNDPPEVPANLDDTLITPQAVLPSISYQLLAFETNFYMFSKHLRFCFHPHWKCFSGQKSCWKKENILVSRFSQ